ncbi:MAG TPA: sulfatase-like hydrolase/transferase [Phycisphaerae bacterium]|nr:sulfatase-like hydrolase/transferase [Phycisphaerae bacterium]
MHRALLIGLVCLPAAAMVSAGESKPQSPNVLIVMCDQLTAGVMSTYGGPVPTPHVDRLAREGVRFTQAICPTPFCSPTRASMITGMYPHAHGIVVNCRQGAVSTGPPGIMAKDVTTEKLLSEAGYATHHYGKWHLSGDRLPYYPDMYPVEGKYLDEMKDTFDKVRRTPRSDWMDWYVWPLPVEIAPAIREAQSAVGEAWKEKRFADFILKIGRLKLPLEQVYDVRVAQLTADRVRSLAGQREPFMITCSFNGPHDPNVVPNPYYDQVDPAGIRLPDNHGIREERFEKDWSRKIVEGIKEPGLREFLRIYYANVRMLDDQVGRVLAALDAAGVADDTIVVFTADHGDMAGGHGMVWKSTSAFYDEIARVPLIIRYPRKLKPQSSDLTTDLTDLMPTLLELLDRPIPSHVQGQSMVPFLTGRRDPAQGRRYAFSERVKASPEGTRRLEKGTTGSFMIRGQGWKFIRYSHGPDKQYLYHLTDDPGEVRNLANDPAYAGKVKELSGEIDAWLERTGWPK